MINHYKVFFKIEILSFEMRNILIIFHIISQNNNFSINVSKCIAICCILNNILLLIKYLKYF